MRNQDSCLIFSCFSVRQSDSQEFPDRSKEIDSLREQGQMELREMLENKEGVNWNAVIQKAKELEEQEQAWLQQCGEQEMKQSEKRALWRRKKFERSGSFLANMVIHKSQTPGNVGDDESKTSTFQENQPTSKVSKLWSRRKSGSSYESLDRVSYSSIRTESVSHS